MRPLFERFPRVRERVRFEPLVSLPTPVTEHRGVWVKRDDLIGGGKYRKLEFYHPPGDLLAWGPEGSNWLRALVRVKPKVRVYTYPQHHNEDSRRNVPHIPARRSCDHLHFGLRMLAELPRVLGGGTSLIPLGGSTPESTLGFVNAALELAGQVERGECPRPDALFVALGTCGMAAGLALGLGLADLDIPIHAVRVGLPISANLRNIWGLASQAAWLLDLRPRLARIILEREFFGGYGVPIPPARAAREFFHPMTLDSSYTAKAAACLLARRPAYRTPLLWLSYGQSVEKSAPRFSQQFA